MKQNDEYPTMPHNLEGLVPRPYMGNSLPYKESIVQDELQYNQVPKMGEFVKKLNESNLISMFVPESE